jgi:hypothetical protein
VCRIINHEQSRLIDSNHEVLHVTIIITAGADKRENEVIVSETLSIAKVHFSVALSQNRRVRYFYFVESVTNDGRKIFHFEIIIHISCDFMPHSATVTIIQQKIHKHSFAPFNSFFMLANDEPEGNVNTE